MTLTERSSPTFLGFQRTPVQPAWIDPTRQEKDPMLVLREGLAGFNEALAEAEALFAQNVYENPNFSPLDARNHHFVLHYYVFRAGFLATHFVALNRPGETNAYVSFLDAEIQRLEKTLQEWHGNPEADPAIPESFKQAMREVNAGQAADMEADMFQEDAGSKTEV